MHASRVDARAKSTGLTLVELLITLAIFAILAAAAAPSYNEVMLGTRLSSFANDFMAASTLARSEAIKRNSTVTLCASTNGATCAGGGDWTQGWVVLAGSERVLARAALPGTYKAVETLAGSTSLAFQSSGAGATQALLKFCQAAPAPGGQERTVTLTATGRASVATTKTGACP